MFSALLKMTLQAPREAAAMLLSAGLPRNAVVMSFMAAMILSVIVTEPLLALVPEETFGPRMTPLTRLFMTVPFSAALVWVIWKFGNAIGGHGQLTEAFLVFAYLEFVLAVGLTIMLGLIFVTPVLAGIAGLSLTVFWVWLLGVFYAEVFGFASAFKGLAVVLLSWLATYIAGILVLTLVAGGGAA